MKPNLGFYVQNINTLVEKTEQIGEGMHPYYEDIRKAIDEDKLADLTSERLAEIHEIFAKGTAEYQAMFAQITTLRPPAKVMGIHKKFERAYKDYVAGCEEMVAATQNNVAVEEFNHAEEVQDQATDTISFCIQRMTNLLLNK